jgi:hypothetical protein
LELQAFSDRSCPGYTPHSQRLNVGAVSRVNSFLPEPEHPASDEAALKKLSAALYCIAETFCSVMPKEHINPDTLFPSLPHGFSQVIAMRGGKTLYISGQTAWDAERDLSVAIAWSNRPNGLAECMTCG